MESLANSILNNAQTVRDGGLIGSILENVQLINNSNIKRDAMPYVMYSRMTGGYVAALFFGILWILALISTMIFLFYLQCKRSKPTSSPNRVYQFRNLLIKKGKINSISVADILQMFAIIIFLIPTILLLCFCITNVSQIHNSIARPARTQEANSTEHPTAILPALKKSLFHLRYYLSTFPDRARENTVPVVDDIIQATKDMQKETMKGFNKKLMRRLGVENTFKYGKEMTGIVVNFFDISNNLLDNQAAYDKIIKSLYPREMNANFGLFKFIQDINDSFNHIANCDNTCREFQQHFNQSFAEVEGFPETNFATSFLFVMKQQNKTRESVIAQTQHGKKEMDKTMAKTQEKMKVLLDIDGTIRNMTGDTWTMMEHKMQPVLELIDNMTVVLDSDAISAKASRYSRLLSAVLILPIVCAIIVLVFALAVIFSLFCSPLRPVHVVLRYGIYLSLILVAFVMLTSTIMFLYGGKFETEFCRYLRTKQPIVETHNDTRVVLDKYINNFLQKTLPKLASASPKSEFPLPKPRNVLYGLVYECRKNEPILAAFKAIDSMDTDSLSKPEVSKKFIDVGRRLLLESLNETDPAKMLPPDMKDSLQQSSQLEMFKKIDIEDSISKVARTPIFVINNQMKIPVSLALFLDRLDKYFSVYGSQIADEGTRRRLNANWKTLLSLTEQFNIITDQVRNIFQNMTNIPPIKPVVTNLGNSLTYMLNILNNKTALFEIGNDYFDRIIVSSTPLKAKGIMAKFGPQMMSKLGHCRPLFEAYQSTIDTTCDVIIMKLNVYWLYLGTVGMLLTCFLVIVYLTMLKTLHSSSKTSLEVNMSKDANLGVSKPLVEVSEKDDKLEKSQV